MAYKVLYRKYRPDSFENLYGQENIKKLLIESIKSNKISHAYIFHGPRGTGKTSTAKIFAKTINCENNSDGIPCGECNSCKNFNESNDIIEIDAASNNGVDEIRNLRDSTKILPNSSKYKIYIIDEVHMLSSSAWNAFLKTLEEPPAHVIFILATTELQKIPLTILSRCQRFSFNRLTSNTICDNLIRICKLENIDIDNEAASLIAELADGAMRDALSILDQLSKENGKIDSKLVYDTFGLVSFESIKKIFEYLESNDIDNLSQIFDDYVNKGLNLNLLINKLLDYIFNLEVDILNGKDYFLSLDDLKNLSNDISSVYGKKDAIILIKIYLLTYFKKNDTKNIKNYEKIEKDVDKSEVINIKIENSVKDDDKKTVNFENEKIEEKPSISVDNLNKIKSIRINNSYVGASKELKKEFLLLWEKFVKKIIDENDQNMLNLVESMSIEVVSPTNVLFSNKSASTVILFNSNLSDIENKFAKNSGVNRKFYCLSVKDWTEEKKKYMELLKNKQNNFVYIDEEDKDIDNKSVASASDLFGESLLEIE